MAPWEDYEALVDDLTVFVERSRAEALIGALAARGDLKGAEAFLFSRPGEGKPRFRDEEGNPYNAPVFLRLHPEHYDEVLATAETWAQEGMEPIPTSPPVREISVPRGSLLIVAGPSGVGKSTLIARAAPAGAAVVVPDDIRDQMEEARGPAGDGHWNEVMRESSRQAGDLLRAGKDVVVHATAISDAQQVLFQATAYEHGRQAFLIFLDGDYETCRAGQMGREKRVPEGYLRASCAQWLHLRRRMQDEPGLMGERGFSGVAVLDRRAVDALERISFS
jgi:predicted kinase